MFDTKHLNYLLFVYRFLSFRCRNSWKPSSPTWRSLPVSTNKRSAKAPSSGSSFRKCVPPSASTRSLVRTLGFYPLYYRFFFMQLIQQKAFLIEQNLYFLIAGKGFWSEMLGVGDFYYELGVQIIEVCLALKHRNGG